MSASAVLIREPGWNTIRAVFELAGETTIGGPGDDVDVGVEGAFAVVTWRDGAWWIRPCNPSLFVDDVPLRDEVALRHGQAISCAYDSPRSWRLRFLVGERERVLDELRHVETIVDGLTGLLNRRVAYQLLGTMLTGVVMLIDIDRLKQINDHFGMLAGDTTIKRTAAILKAHIAWPNVVARYGGEEFVVIMPDAGLAAARALAEQIRRAAEPAFDFEGEPITATVSIGLALDAQPHSGAATMRAADEALMDAKTQGRNRVIG